jgi:hypothetical protein
LQVLDWVIQRSHHPIELEEDDYDSDEDNFFDGEDEEEGPVDPDDEPSGDEGISADIIDEQLAEAEVNEEQMPDQAGPEIPPADGQNPPPPPPPPPPPAAGSGQDRTAQLCEDVSMMNRISSW